MSVKIKNLSKKFGNQMAVNDISFEVSPGEIVGFLGPNGAGKSTTMKIITAYLSPTRGSVEVCGFDVAQNSAESKKMIGYLAEHNPLYLDMYIHEYLRFIGKLHGLRAKILRNRVEEMVNICGLTEEQNKVIGSLSKGYRQRVGLAQALIHDPQVLILDEPTTGLDPNQIIEIRRLIGDVSQNKTVIFSTHIMQEVQAICSRAIIINKGKIAADDKIENLKDMIGGGTQKILLEFSETVDKGILESIDGVTEVQVTGEKSFILIAKATADQTHVISKFAADNGLLITGLKVEEGSMEDIFKELTTQEE